MTMKSITTSILAVVLGISLSSGAWADAAPGGDNSIDTTGSSPRTPNGVTTPSPSDASMSSSASAMPHKKHHHHKKHTANSSSMGDTMGTNNPQ